MGCLSVEDVCEVYVCEVLYCVLMMFGVNCVCVGVMFVFEWLWYEVEMM